MLILDDMHYPYRGNTVFARNPVVPLADSLYHRLQIRPSLRLGKGNVRGEYSAKAARAL
jgi:hypothetical protein